MVFPLTLPPLVFALLGSGGNGPIYHRSKDTIIKDQQECPPFKAMFVMDKNYFNGSFVQLRRFLGDFVKVLPDETIFQVITLKNNVIEKLKFKKQELNGTWLEEIGLSSFSHGVIEYTTVSDAISNFFDKKENQEMAEHIYLLVNEKTVVDNVKKVKEAMKGQMVQIVLYGIHKCIKGNVTELSEHIHVLGVKIKEIKPIVQAVMRDSYIGKYTSKSTMVHTGQGKNPPKDPVCCNSFVSQALPIINTILIIGCVLVYIFYMKRSKCSCECRKQEGITSKIITKIQESQPVSETTPLAAEPQKRDETESVQVSINDSGGDGSGGSGLSGEILSTTGGKLGRTKQPSL